MKLRYTLLSIVFLIGAGVCFYVAIAIPGGTKIPEIPGLYALPHPAGAILIGVTMLLCAFLFWFRRGTDF